MKFDYYYGSQAEQFSFIRIPRVMLTDEAFASLSLQAKVLFSVFLDRMGISMRNGWFDEKNRVFIIYQISEIQEDLGFSKRKAMDYLAELEKFGLVEKKKEDLGFQMFCTSRTSSFREIIPEVSKWELMVQNNPKQEVLKSILQRCEFVTSEVSKW